MKLSAFVKTLKKTKANAKKFSKKLGKPITLLENYSSEEQWELFLALIYAKGYKIVKKGKRK